MQLKKGQEEIIEIESVAFGGKGIGKFEDIVVFVPKVITGDKVKVSFKKIKKRYIEAELVEIVSESDLRKESKCKHFKEGCGGCTWQFLSYEEQLKLKEQHVKDAFLRLGGFEDANVLSIIGCEHPFYYRNKMEYSFGDTVDREFALGLHLPKRRYDILNVEECFLLSEESNEILNTVREWALDKDLEHYNFRENTGVLRNLIIREGKNTDETMVNLVINYGHLDKVKDFADLIKADSVYVTEVRVEKGRRTEKIEHFLKGNSVLNEELVLQDKSRLRFEILPQAFFQPNTYQAQILYSEAVKAANLTGEENVVDLYCGTGTIGLFLSKFAGGVFGIEINESAIENAKKNAQLNGIENVDFMVGDVSKILSDLELEADVVVVDPPRAGLKGKAHEDIIKFGPKRIVYVSCNPSTLARDCSVFKDAGYSLISVQPVDMFPQTYHVENVALLELSPAE